MQRFIGAALELITTNGGKDFTVQEVVERSGQSLRSFYQHFDGKHELLLALFEESVLSTVQYLRAQISRRVRSPRAVAPVRDRVLPGLQPSDGPERAMARKGAPPVVTDFAQQLLTERPKEAARAFAPLVDMFCELLDDALAAGVVRTGLGSRAAGMVLEAVMFNAFSSTIGGTSAHGDDTMAAEELWDLVANGIVVSPRR